MGAGVGCFGAADGGGGEVGGDGFGDGAYESAGGIAAVGPAHGVGINRFAGGIDSGEVGVGAVREFRGNAPAAIEFIEVVVLALGFAEVAQVKRNPEYSAPADTTR